MKKYIVLSVNDNPEYLFYMPLVIWAWKKFGWTPMLFFKGVTDMRFCLSASYSMPFIYLQIDNIDPYHSDTLSQISRLYGACRPTEGFLMTGDIDMLPLSDYWKEFDENEITIWGHDLTGYGHYPICYIGMPSTRWREVMGLTSEDYNTLIKRDLDKLPQARSEDSVKRWVTDQDLITERLNQTQFNKNFVSRGVLPNGYAFGRVDRSAWTLNHPQLIDCHMLRGIWRDSGALLMTMDLLHKVWPEENFKWFEDYTKEFKKLIDGQHG